MNQINDETCYWRCPNCGQIHFGDAPPDMCDFCRDFTTWQLIAGTQSSAASDHPTQPGEKHSDDESNANPHPTHRPHQRRLFD